MLNSTVIKRLHFALTVVLLLVVCVVAGYQYYINKPPDDGLFAQQQVTPDIYLYVTKYKGGGATVSDVYRYYLDTRQQGDILTHLKDRSPFLVADVGTAKVTGYGAHVNVIIAGRVYSFTNSDLFYADGVAIMPVIDFNATGVR
ncbi:hypothetical protein [Enterobacter sp.]|uniref:hypothetical protein n=1 Tax=Enterobacter sp. TaxID=42895 RepID=UPI00296FBB81|nr:hypothetical protein [Enterobacter sp.]